jgi:hypothetical protein
MRPFWSAVAAVIALCSSTPAQPLQADGVYRPPPSAKELADSLHPIPPRTLDGYLDRLRTTHTYDELAGMNAELEKVYAGTKPLVAGRNYDVDMGSAELFDAPILDGSFRVFQAGVVSIDAVAMRLKTDLTGLRESDELFVVDTVTLRAFGPYTRRDARQEGNWLAATEGSAAVLLARTKEDTAPVMTLLELSHMFRAMPPLKAAECHNSIACEGDESLQNVSTGVARYTYSSGRLLYLCTATLINNPVTDELEPYVLTANHCLPTGTTAATAEFYWDYRPGTCESDHGPPLGTLLRSQGEALVDTDSRLDISLATVDDVPSGSYGRYWAGWSTSALVLNDDVVGIHHPDGDFMRISYGRVVDTSVTTLSYDDQIEVLWDTFGVNSGFTEGGSSGSCLLPSRLGYRIVGVLSNGNFVNCSSPVTSRWDRYGSFREFYPAIRSYINGTAMPPDGDPATTPGAVACPAKAAFADYPELLEQLRALRDEGLAGNALGRALTRAYYRAAPVLANMVERDDGAKSLFLAAAGPAARIGEWLSR